MSSESHRQAIPREYHRHRHRHRHVPRYATPHEMIEMIPPTHGMASPSNSQHKTYMRRFIETLSSPSIKPSALPQHMTTMRRKRGLVIRGVLIDIRTRENDGRQFGQIRKFGRKLKRYVSSEPLRIPTGTYRRFSPSCSLTIGVRGCHAIESVRILTLGNIRGQHLRYLQVQEVPRID